MKPIVLTTMCMVFDHNDNFLVENRVKKDWPGLTFPGGHVEDDETIEEACVREMKEETGLTVSSLECMGHIEWNDFGDGIRHLAICFRSDKYEGKLTPSKEGDIFFIKEDDINKYHLSNDFAKIYSLMKGKQL